MGVSHSSPKIQREKAKILLKKGGRYWPRQKKGGPGCRQNGGTVEKEDLWEYVDKWDGEADKTTLEESPLDPCTEKSLKENEQNRKILYTHNHTKGRKKKSKKDETRHLGVVERREKRLGSRGLIGGRKGKWRKHQETTKEFMKRKKKCNVGV